MKYFDELLFKVYRGNADVHYSRTALESTTELEKIKTAFLSGEIDFPVVHYEDIDDKSLTNLKQDLVLALDTELELLLEGPSEHKTLVTGWYRRMINNRIKAIDLVFESQRITADQDHSTADYVKIVNELYDADFDSHFKNEIGLLRNINGSQLDHMDQGIVSELSNIVELSESDDKPFNPSQQVLDKTRGYLIEKFADIFDTVDSYDSNSLSSGQVLEVFSKALSAYNWVDWNVQVFDRTHTSVSRQSHLVKLADKNYTKSRLKKLIVHEVGAHVSRISNGQRLPYRILSIGTPGSRKFEEGLGIAFAQSMSISGKTHMRGINTFIAICLSKGLDGSGVRNFSQTHEALWRIMYIRRKYLLSTPTTVESTQSRAYDICFRIFRGTRYIDPGICFPKDAFYYLDQVQAWKMLEQANDDEITEFRSCKYNPADKEQTAFVRKLTQPES